MRILTEDLKNKEEVSHLSFEKAIMGCCKESISISSLAICFCNMSLSFSLAVAVAKTSWVGYLFMVVFFLWNIGLPFRSLTEPRFASLFSCLGVMVLLAISFTLITRYHYYERWPKYPEEREGLYSSLLVHKMGLIGLVSGIPIIYGCKCRQLINDKKMIYRVIVDFIDIYEMADILALGAPSCTRLHSSNTYNYTRMNDGHYNNTMNDGQYNNTMNDGHYNNTSMSDTSEFERYNQPRQLFNCIESPYAALRENGSVEKAVQVLCSFSFLMFFMLYVRAYEDYEEKHYMKKHIRIARLVQDVSFFGIRSFVWIMYGFRTDQFVFLVKNVVSGIIISLEFCSSYESPESNQTSRSSNTRQQTSQTNRGFQGNTTV